MTSWGAPHCLGIPGAVDEATDFRPDRRDLTVALVLGAGATLANAEHFHGERRVGQNPPLDNTFFDRVRTLEIQVPTELREYAFGLPYLNPFVKQQEVVRAEEFFRDLFADFQEAAPGSPTVRAFEQLVTIYTRVLRETTNWMGEDNKKGGPVGRLIAAAAADDELTILTFNHDLVIENEIAKRARLSSRWCVDRGYGSFSQSAVIASSVTGSFRRHDSNCTDESRHIRLLKLHGSLNWYVRMNGRHPSPNILSGQSAPPKIRISPRRFIRVQLRSTRPAASGPGRTSWYTWPVIIPPVFGKEALIRNFVPSVWADAEEWLRRADRVIFFGYSLPELDIRAQRLLQRYVGTNDKLRWIDLVNPDPQSAGRYASLLRPPAVRWYPTLSEFIDEGDLKG
jgi:hypothetical protein